MRAFLRAFEKRLAAQNPRSSSNPAYVSRKVPDLKTTALQERITTMHKLQNLPDPAPAVHKLLPHVYLVEGV